jgi:hypothetical protein
MRNLILRASGLAAVALIGAIFATGAATLGDPLSQGFATPTNPFTLTGASYVTDQLQELALSP